MTVEARQLEWLTLEQYLDWFERQARSQSVDLAAFLPPPEHPCYLEILREMVCSDMEFAQARGESRCLQDYLRRFPILTDPESLAELQRHQARLAVEPTRLMAAPSDPPMSWRQRGAALYEQYRQQPRVPLTCWLGSAEQADLFLELQRHDPDAAWLLADTVPRPEPGTEFLGFRLLRELGRGTFGRVFLAEQKGLANRLVALKVGQSLVSETRVLAQLQHSNIMPIYSVHQAGPVQALCMPFLGSTTLADVLEHMHCQGQAAAQSNAVWSTLHQRAQRTRLVGEPDSDPSVWAPAVEIACLDRLRGMSSCTVALWLVAQLADGLAHAHSRGILHRDIKPANVLLANDGTPLLLDFNLSEDPHMRGGVPAVLGGTLPYMAPEHLQAFIGTASSVDQRSDIYSLGLVLFELLTGRATFPTYQGPIREQIEQMILDRRQGPSAIRGVTPAVRAILGRCLEADPARRYQSAQELRDDLQCQLNHQPLRHTPEPSSVERLLKFVRRQPRLVFAGVSLLLLTLLLILGGSHYQRSQQLQQARTINERRAFLDDFREATILLSLPQLDPTERAEGRALCHQALARYGLPEDLHWESRPEVTALPIEERQTLREEIGELFLLLARVSWLDGGLDQAVLWNQRAELLLASTHHRAVLLQRAWLNRLQQREAEAAKLLQQAEQLPLQTARDYYILASAHCTRGEIREAITALEEATRRDPASVVAWAIRGACHAALSQHAEAAATLTTTLALRPEFWRGYHWRGRAYLELKEFARAEADFTEVLSRRPEFVPALVCRAQARLARKHYAGAEADLTAALDFDPDHTRLYFLRARVRRAAGDLVAAQRDFDEGMRRQPTDELSWLARGEARLPGDPKGALADFEQALRLNPHSYSAAQNKAHVLAEYLQKPVQAIATLDPVITRHPDYTEARIGRGVLHARLGHRQAALDDARESLRRDTRPLILYQAGCIYALTSRQEPSDQLEAFRLLRRALTEGFGAEYLSTDPDLRPLHVHPEFQPLLKLAKKSGLGK